MGYHLLPACLSQICWLTAARPHLLRHLDVASKMQARMPYNSKSATGACCHNYYWGHAATTTYVRTTAGALAFQGGGGHCRGGGTTRGGGRGGRGGRVHCRHDMAPGGSGWKPCSQNGYSSNNSNNNTYVIVEVVVRTYVRSSSSTYVSRSVDLSLIMD